VGASADQQVSRAAWAVCCPLGDGVAILDAQKDNYFSLNEVGSVIWNLIETPVTLRVVAAAVVNLYDISFDLALSDVSALVAALAAEGLVTLGHAST
jgi:hypothetical protein